jgi:hypothetical protein
MLFVSNFYCVSKVWSVKWEFVLTLNWTYFLWFSFSLCGPHFPCYLKKHSIFTGGPGNSVGIVTGYRLNGPGIESRWGCDFFAHIQAGPGAHPASCTMGTRSFPGVKQPGRGADHPPPSSTEVLRIELYVYPLSRPGQACNRNTLPLQYLPESSMTGSKFRWSEDDWQ